MDSLTFIEKIVGSAIWPVTVLVIVLILKRPIISLLARLKRFKGKDIELELGVDFESIERASKAALGASGAEAADDQRDRYSLLLKSSPKTVIVENWKRIELSLSQALLDSGVDLADEDFRHPMRLAEKARLSGIVDEDRHALIKGMLILRNKVVHYEPLSIRQKDAKVYYDNAVLILNALKDGRREA